MLLLRPRHFLLDHRIREEHVRCERDGQSHCSSGQLQLQLGDERDCALSFSAVFDQSWRAQFLVWASYPVFHWVRAYGKRKEGCRNLTQSQEHHVLERGYWRCGGHSWRVVLTSPPLTWDQECDDKKFLQAQDSRWLRYWLLWWQRLPWRLHPDVNSANCQSWLLWVHSSRRLWAIQFRLYSTLDWLQTYPRRTRIIIEQKTCFPKIRWICGRKKNQIRERSSWKSWTWREDASIP